LCERCHPGNNAVKHIPYDQYLDKVNYQLSHGGVFLTSHKEKDNTMIMGWGGITWYWRRPDFHSTGTNYPVYLACHKRDRCIYRQCPP
jgi:hypothetical protein